MSSDDRLIAARYVQALFDLASESSQHDNVKADMLMLKSVVEGSVEFQKLLANPILSREDSEAAIIKVLTAINASELTKKFFVLLARKHRLKVTSIAIDKYLELLAEARGELTVHVTSATALGEEEKNILTGTLAKSTGKKVELKSSVNPDLLGGLKVRVGSKMLDNSVAGKLARLKQTLTQAA